MMTTLLNGILAAAGWVAVYMIMTAAGRASLDGRRSVASSLAVVAVAAVIGLLILIPPLGLLIGAALTLVFVAAKNRMQRMRVKRVDFVVEAPLLDASVPPSLVAELAHAERALAESNKSKVQDPSAESLQGPSEAASGDDGGSRSASHENEPTADQTDPGR